MSSPGTQPYGSWRSPITSDLIVAESIGLSDALVDGDELYWLESRPREGGRSVLVRRGVDGQVDDATPAPFSLLSRVHEYGGGAVAVADGTIYFVHLADQRLYRHRFGEPPVAVTPPSDPVGSLRYADGIVDRRRGRWIGVRERHVAGAVENTLVAIDLARGGAGEIIVQGRDFYASPRLAPDGGRLAWLAWQHPNMPWVGTELWVAAISDDGSLTDTRLAAGGPAESIFQPEWSPDGLLTFVSDRSGWWNLYRIEDDTAAARALCPRAAEFGRAQWVFGMSTYAYLSPRRLACSFIENGSGRLALLDPVTAQLAPLDLPYTDFGSLAAAGTRIVCRVGSPTTPTAIVRLDVESGAVETLRQAMPSSEALRPYFSVPRHLNVPTTGGQTVHAHYYPPTNPDFAAPAGETPPMVVKCHGGPTSAASQSLSYGTQYWTSRGVAVLDVDYGGSTGYGREYRERLRGAWGVVDVEDCANAARYAAAQGLADPSRVVISGGSAGGYTVLAALARGDVFGDVFKGGASYYGISDIAALARDTHKFESRYLDWLIGPYPEREDLYRERSPIHHVDGLRCPVIFFQGGKDRVVPPNQTELMVDALHRKKIPVGYLLFEGEAHGFRRADTIKRALDAELGFYAALVFGTRLTF